MWCACVRARDIFVYCIPWLFCRILSFLLILEHFCLWNSGRLYIQNLLGVRFCQRLRIQMLGAREQGGPVKTSLLDLQVLAQLEANLCDEANDVLVGFCLAIRHSSCFGVWEPKFTMCPVRPTKLPCCTRKSHVFFARCGSQVLKWPLCDFCPPSWGSRNSCVFFLHDLLKTD